METADAYARAILEEVNLKSIEIQISRKLWVHFDGEFSLRLEGRNLGEPEFAARAFLKQMEHLASKTPKPPTPASAPAPAPAP